MTSGGVADPTGTDERYVREWLETGGTGLSASRRGPRRTDPAMRCRRVGPRRWSTRTARLIAPLARQSLGMLGPLPRLVEAFRTGTAPVPALRRGHPRRHRGAQPGDVRQRARQRCGSRRPGRARPAGAPRRAGWRTSAAAAGWSSIAIARAYPRGGRGHRLDGPPSTRRAPTPRPRVWTTASASSSGDAGELRLGGRLRSGDDLRGAARHGPAGGGARRRPAALADGRHGVVVDERVAESFTAPGDEIERLMYGFSVLHCLAVTRRPSIGRDRHRDAARHAARLRREAGFSASRCCRSRTTSGASTASTREGHGATALPLRVTGILLIHGGWHGPWCWDDFARPAHRARPRGPDRASCAATTGGRPDLVPDRATTSRTCGAPRRGSPSPGPRRALAGRAAGAEVPRTACRCRGLVLMASVPTAGTIRRGRAPRRAPPAGLLKANLLLSLRPFIGHAGLVRDLFFTPDTPQPIVDHCHARLQDESYLAFLDILTFVRAGGRRVERRYWCSAPSGTRSSRSRGAPDRACLRDRGGDPSRRGPRHDARARAGSEVADRVDAWVRGTPSPIRHKCPTGTRRT